MLKHAHKFPVKSAALILCAFVTALAVFALCAYAAEPGSTADPIALKSYVDAKISELEAKLSSMTKQSGQAGGAASQQGGDTQYAAQENIRILANRIDELTRTVASLKTENENLKRSISQIAAGAGAGIADAAGMSSGGLQPDQFEAVEVLTNQRVVLGAGTEMVLRTGKALSIRGESGAVVDLILGQDLDAGANVPLNHLLISPRDDNRGVRITETAWILIKGRYTIR